MKFHYVYYGIRDKILMISLYSTLLSGTNCFHFHSDECTSTPYSFNAMCVPSSSPRQNLWCCASQQHEQGRRVILLYCMLSLHESSACWPTEGEQQRDVLS